MGVLSYLLLAIVLALAVIAFLASRKPSVFRVERHGMVNAPPENVFPLINTMKAWNSWSPWAKKDPTMKSTYSGPETGVGAAQAWEGNSQVGKGRMEIVESVPFSRVAMRLEFFKPMKNTCGSSFTLTPKDGGTEVRWAMEGPNLFMGKVMSLFINMDEMIGKDFEAGLRSLKEKAEG